GLAGHLLVDPLESADQTADVVLAVSVVPDVVDNLLNGPVRLLGRLGRDGGRVAGELQQAAIEAIEHDEVRLVRASLALPGAPAQHLLEQDARLDRPKEDEKL